MENPFEEISQRLIALEKSIGDIQDILLFMSGKKSDNSKNAMNLDEFCEFTGFAKQTAYRLTSSNRVPFSKQGKKLWFDRGEVEKWLLQNHRLTTSEAQDSALSFIESQSRMRYGKQ